MNHIGHYIEYVTNSTPSRRARRHRRAIWPGILIIWAIGYFGWRMSV